MTSHVSRRVLVACIATVAAVFGGVTSRALGVCGPFADVTDAAFCPFVLEVFYSGITTGTTATTYDPTSAVSRLQMAAFLSRTVDGVVGRVNRRAALNQFWTTQQSSALRVTTVGQSPSLPASDGADVWVPNYGSNTVSRVRASDGRLLETWTGATDAFAALVAMGYVFVTADHLAGPGGLYRIDPSQAAGLPTLVASNLGDFPEAIAFDGSRVWTANVNSSVSIVTPDASVPWTVTTVTTGFNLPRGLAFDGANMWVADRGNDKLIKLTSSGVILQTVTLGSGPIHPIFDGTNIWVPNIFDNAVSVVRASTGAVLATLTGNGLSQPTQAAFDGQRILVTNAAGPSVSLWNAASLKPIGQFFFPGRTPYGVCSDGQTFWLTLQITSQPGLLGRF